MKTLTSKILDSHVVEEKCLQGEEIAIKIDQTLTQDATGTMSYLQFEAIGIDRVRTELSVSYIDHNTLQCDFRNADDQRYLQTIAQRYGLYFSRPGNGICHQVHLERFAHPGKTLLGSDSHTPTAGGMSVLAIGAGGLDVAEAMAGMPFTLKYPKIFGIRLIGKLSSFVSAKDVILELLRLINVDGGLGYILEYFGSGVSTLSIQDRATICNMGAETGATSSIFPSDEVTKQFLAAQNRKIHWQFLHADEGAKYDKEIEIDLSKIIPLAACPDSPGNIMPVSELGHILVNQVAIGSCTNSSIRDFNAVAIILKNKVISENLHLIINPGSRQVVNHLVESGDLTTLISAGARIQENTCGACAGLGGAPGSEGVSVRTYNRNFRGRCGTRDANVYLVSPETAAVTAIFGKITDPRTINIEALNYREPTSFFVNDNMLIPPLSSGDADKIHVIRGPNIKPLPKFDPIKNLLVGEVLIKVEDNITTDHIIPAGAKVMPLRSNIPKISEFVFEACDSTFFKRAKEKKGGFVIGGDNYGQGSSREHAAIAPKYLGIKAVIAKSFARIHMANLINFGIVPLTFENRDDFNLIEKNDLIKIDISELKDGRVILNNIVNNLKITLNHSLSKRDVLILSKGGKLPWIRHKIYDER